MTLFAMNKYLNIVWKSIAYFVKHYLVIDMNQFHLIVLVDCLPGYYGENCKKSCRYPNYGVNCQEGCNCSKIACNHIIGCFENALDGKKRERERERGVCC